MARTPRIIIPGQTTHVIQRGNNRQATFRTQNDYLQYLNILHQLTEEYECALHAYTLMTNHVHLLVTPCRDDGVSLLMQGIGRKYVRYFNSTYRRSGTLWEGRYKSALIDSERYLLTCSRYIELNPVRAGIVDRPGGYHWSSYRTNALGQSDACLTPHDVYRRLGSNPAARQKAYRSLFGTRIPNETLTLLRRNTQQCTIIGGKQFQKAVQNALNRRVVKYPHGGDRRSERYKEYSSVLTPCMKEKEAHRGQETST